MLRRVINFVNKGNEEINVKDCKCTCICSNIIFHVKFNSA